MTFTHLGATRIMGPESSARILLVGEDNPVSTAAHFALYHEPANCAGHRLQSKILGVDARHTYLPMWRTNLCVGGWDEADAMERAVVLGSALRGEPTPWRVIVMLGVKVQRAFRRAGIADVATFDTLYGDTSRSTVFVSLPHPSGRNTLWNDPAKITIAREVMASVAPDVPWGEIA